MLRTANEEVEVMSIAKAVKLTGIGKAKISAAMDKYQASRGRIGLAFIPAANEGGFRRIRRSSLRAWLERLETEAIYVG